MHPDIVRAREASRRVLLAHLNENVPSLASWASRVLARAQEVGLDRALDEHVRPVPMSALRRAA
ncbi:hypothetical protein GMYAFLOJ_CDS0072 [Microbacterium phage phiMiGM15]